MKIIAEKEKLVPLYDALKENEKLNITYYYDVYDPKLWYLEVFSSAASKEQGVRYLRENYGFDFVTAFGDNTNDLPMFKAADKRVAVKNACKEVLEGCDQVTGTNEEDGVAEYLLKTFERNQLWQGYIHFFHQARATALLSATVTAGYLLTQEFPANVFVRL